MQDKTLRTLLGHSNLVAWIAIDMPTSLKRILCSHLKLFNDVPFMMERAHLQSTECIYINDAQSWSFTTQSAVKDKVPIKLAWKFQKTSGHLESNIAQHRQRWLVQGSILGPLTLPSAWLHAYLLYFYRREEFRYSLRLMSPTGWPSVACNLGLESCSKEFRVPYAGKDHSTATDTGTVSTWLMLNLRDFRM